MRYADYRLEDMVFTNKEDWTDEEKLEVLLTFPETKDIARVIETCDRIHDDIDNGTIKVNRYGDINKASAKSYANKHQDCFYGSVHRYSDNDFYILVDGEKQRIGSAFGVTRLIESCNDMNSRFDRIRGKYLEKERQAAERRTKENYTADNKDRISANKMAYDFLRAVRIEIPVDVVSTFYGNEVRTKTLKDLDLRTNRYGEMVNGDTVISEETADALGAMVRDLSKELSDIIDIYNGRYKDILRKNNVG